MFVPMSDEILVIPMSTKVEMAKIPVSTETRVKRDKNGKVSASLTYVPWIEARMLLEKHFPNLKVDFETFPMVSNNHTYSVPWCDCGEMGLCLFPYIKDVVSGKRTPSIFYPVMDYVHKAQLSPTVVDINNSIQRASSKVIALETWIGISVYQKIDESIPPDNLMEEVVDKGREMSYDKDRQQEQERETSPPRLSRILKTKKVQ